GGGGQRTSAPVLRTRRLERRRPDEVEHVRPHGGSVPAPTRTVTGSLGVIPERSCLRALPTPELVLVDGSTALDEFRVTESIPGEGRFLTSAELGVGERLASEEVPDPCETSDVGSLCASRAAHAAQGRRGGDRCPWLAGAGGRGVCTRGRKLP